MAKTKIGEFLTDLATSGHLDMWRVVELIFILIILARLYKMGKKQPDKERWVTSVSLGGFLAIVAPFALIQALSVVGLRLFDADWAKLRLTPLDIMFGVSVVLESVMSGEKLFGTINTTPPDGSLHSDSTDKTVGNIDDANGA